MFLKNILVEELLRNDYQIYRSVKLKETDLLFDILAESSNNRIIFVVETIDDSSNQNTLKGIAAKLESLRQIFAVHNENRMLILIIITLTSKSHVIEELERYMSRKDSYRKILMYFDQSKLSNEIILNYVRSILPSVSLKRNISDFISKDETAKYLDDLFKKYPAIKPIFTNIKDRLITNKDLSKEMLRLL